VTRDLVINVEDSITTIVLLEDNKLVELHKENKNKKFSVGDIYIAKVKKIMNGLNAAFVEIGYKRDAFLHYLDLGAQFSSLNSYVHSSINHPNNTPTFSSYNQKPDINKFGKVSQVLTVGQKILVQITKEPISTKGPRLTSEISIAGRNLVLLPFSNKVSISQRIKSKEERKRLKGLIHSIKPKNYGVIIRTVASKRRVAELDVELRKLVKRWEDALKDLAGTEAPKLLVSELDQTSALLRDLLNNSFNSIVVNNKDLYYEIKDYINSISPGSQKIMRLYTGKDEIYKHFGVDRQIKTLFGKTVTIKNGAYLIIEHTEALHVIDVNSGNRTNKKKDQETNAYEVNLASADEIARQLRLRDMGGIIVVDFIDMQKQQYKKEVFDRMKEQMSIDKTKHSILPLTKFGLMQITRQRVRQEMNIQTVEPCPVCDGTGEVAPSSLFIEEIETTLKRIIKENKSKKIVLKLHPYIYSHFTKGIYPMAMKWKFKHFFNLKVKKKDDYNFLEYYFFDEKNTKIQL